MFAFVVHCNIAPSLQYVCTCIQVRYIGSILFPAFVLLPALVRTKKEAKKLGLTTVDATVSESSEIRQVVESLKGKVDAIYSPTDNMIAAGINTVSMVANEAKIPFIVAEEGMCTGGGLATYGVNYYKLGQQTAKQAVKILEGKAEPKDMPIEYQENADLIINKDTVKTLGIKIPEKLKKEAKMVTTQKKTDKE